MGSSEKDDTYILEGDHLKIWKKSKGNSVEELIKINKEVYLELKDNEIIIEI